MSDGRTCIPVSLDDYERLAERALDENAWAYISGGSGDEVSLHWNRSAFNDYAIMPRVLVKSPSPTTSVALLDRTLAHPLIVAPLAYQKLAHPAGEHATAAAAAAQDALMVLSTLSSTSIEDVARVEGRACCWFQLYFQEHREDTLKLVRRAEDAGYEAIVVTVDATLSGVRNKEQRIGFQLPETVRAVNLSPPRAAQVADHATNNQSNVFREFMRIAPTWQDVEWLAEATRLAVIVKGVAAPADADIAIESGASAIIVSNHGGRVLDTVPASLHLLPPVIEKVRRRVPVLMDGGIRRGTDVFKCLALGAGAVLIGRPILYGLAVGGARGVSHVLRILRDELEIAMVLSGCMSIEDISAARLARPGVIALG